MTNATSLIKTRSCWPSLRRSCMFKHPTTPTTKASKIIEALISGESPETGDATGRSCPWAMVESFISGPSTTFWKQLSYTIFSASRQKGWRPRQTLISPDVSSRLFSNFQVLSRLRIRLEIWKNAAASKLNE